MARNERPGLFTQRQRDYLNGDLELEGGLERSIRKKIRDRVDTAFAEFSLLSKVDPNDRRQVFEQKLAYDEDDIEVKAGDIDPGFMKRDKGEWEAGGGLGMGVGLGHLIQFAYTGLREQGVSPDLFGTMLTFYIKRAEQELGQDLLSDDIEVTFDVETVSTVDVDRAKTKLKAGQDLSALELKALVEAGVLEINEA